MSWTSWNRNLWFLPDSLLWFLALKCHVCLVIKLGLINESINGGHWIEPHHRGSKCSAADPCPFSRVTVISFSVCNSSPNLLPNTPSQSKSNVNLCIWHEIFHYVCGHWWQRAELNAGLEGWIRPVHTIIRTICKLSNKCNLYQICAGTHVGGDRQQSSGVFYWRRSTFTICKYIASRAWNDNCFCVSRLLSPPHRLLGMRIGSGPVARSAFPWYQGGRNAGLQSHLRQLAMSVANVSFGRCKESARSCHLQ